MMAKINCSALELSQRAIGECISYSEQHKSDIFIRYFAHTNELLFEVYENGWNLNKKYLFKVEVSLSGIFAPKTPEEMKQKLKPLYQFMNENS